MGRYATVVIDLDLQHSEKVMDYGHGMDELMLVQLWAMRVMDEDGLCPSLTRSEFAGLTGASFCCELPDCPTMESNELLTAMIKHGFITVENGKWRVNVWKVLRIDAEEPDKLGCHDGTENSTEANVESDAGIFNYSKQVKPYSQIISEGRDHLKESAGFVTGEDKTSFQIVPDESIDRGTIGVLGRNEYGELDVKYSGKITGVSQGKPDNNSRVDVNGIRYFEYDPNKPGQPPRTVPSSIVTDPSTWTDEQLGPKGERYLDGDDVLFFILKWDSPDYAHYDLLLKNSPFPEIAIQGAQKGYANITRGVTGPDYFIDSLVFEKKKWREYYIAKRRRELANGK